MTIPTQKGHHAFAEFSLVHNFGAVHIADDLSFEAAATLPVGLLTAAHSLFHSLQLQPLGSAPSDTFVLIWGASGSVGTYAVQLASLAGLKVIATASPRNFDLLKTLGAAHVFDYRDPNVVNLIKETAQGNLHYAFDATSPEAALLCSQALAVDGPARLHTIVELPKGLPPHITATLGLLEFAHKVPEDIKFLTEFTAQVEPYLASGKIRPNKVELLQGGLTAIPDAFQRMYDNKVSAVKLVANIADTKSQL
jgi:NADPH:quinone reductase-like Zn-dependent oxidoreductase